MEENERLLNCDPVRCSSPLPNNGICLHSCHAFCSPVCLLLQRYSVTQCHSIHLIFAKQTFGQLQRNLYCWLLNHMLAGAKMSRWPWFYYLEATFPISWCYFRHHQDWYLVKEINLIGFGADSFSCFLSQDSVSKWAMLCFWDAFQTFYWVNVFPQFLGITIANFKSRNNLEQ